MEPMDMITFLEPDFSFSDERGFLIQLCRDGWKQINVSASMAGARRGGHYHKNNREAFFVIEGCIDIELELYGEKKVCVANKGDFFVIHPYVRHVFQYPVNTVAIAMYDKGVENDDDTMDIYSI